MYASFGGYSASFFVSNVAVDGNVAAGKYTEHDIFSVWQHLPPSTLYSIF
jgi:hypothetical protein